MDELQDLSDHTRHALSYRRMWFLERLLKLGSIDVRKEYACVSFSHVPSCRWLCPVF
jgi:hypothetical protein